ncbi:hypothetical protein A3C37_00880 [Candidatus Peribacteria bacterium RIFCSPHIGHO2_02_FULL_53_20]|nr:MAG: hypothetical protein A3C37_00880 [Candidatus Peribacteria bacterium RIFCSPHIGHO2_02_FULL_53_20]OGJ73314.1 MAG: hypothetical protein A3G69_02665 [Candidatus Peribacteria bacterium RIFCSPLOWO2_12_FULL_53_10]
MHVIMPPPQSEISAEGHSRRLSLYEWMTRDLIAKDRTLARTLNFWRTDVLSRLHGRNPDKPTKVRLPWMCVGMLGLQNQFVLICEDNTVCVIDRKENDRYIPGRVLINGQR